MSNQEQLEPQGTASETDAQASFEDFKLIPEVAQAVEKMGFKVPTPIQVGTYKKAMAGEDVIGMAQTGTGKTAAFGIPLVQRLDPKKKAVQALVLTPTRELALQVTKEINQLGQIRGISCVTVYGGASFTRQVEEVSQGVQIVVGTPGRVLDHIRRGTISFDKLGILVLDEADEMLSMGFEKEISAIIESLPQKRQTLLFSATIPDDIQRLTQRYMEMAPIVSVSGDHIGAEEVSHFVYIVSGQNRMQDMVAILHSERPESALIFCNTRDDTQALARYLQRAGFEADWLNSDLSQSERERVMERTHKGELKFLVATDVAARGIDISNISHVMNYTFPESLEVYIHRTGRTGRAGRHGMAISLITPQDLGNLYYLRLTYKIFPVEKTLPDEQAKTRNLDLDRLDLLREKQAGGVNGEFVRLARRVMQDVRAERIIGWLLARHFSAQGDGIPVEAKAKEPEVFGKEPDKPDLPPQAFEPGPEAVKTKASKRKTKAAKTKAKTAQSEAKKAAPQEKGDNGAESKPAAASDQTAPKDGDDRHENEIFVDAGRKDGLRIATLMQEIVRITGLSKAAVGRIRMLTRSTFVSVSKEHFSTVLAALGQIEIDGRKLKAEPKE